jgi:hypothetical protein
VADAGAPFDLSVFDAWLRGLSADDKLQIAEIMGIATPDTVQAKNSAHEFRSQFIDNMLHASHDPASGTSQIDTAYLAFPLSNGGQNSGDLNAKRKHDIAKMQFQQFPNLLAGVFGKDSLARGRVFATALSSGRPGGDIDVHLHVKS